MKIILILAVMLLTPLSLMAQTLIEVSPITIDLTTFTGVVSVITMLVTQIAKLIPPIDSSKIAKILTAIIVGMIVCLLAWILHISPLLTESMWWEALIYGIAAGLSSCGLYDLVKAIGALFKKDEFPDKG